mmetsp:Transcript_58212/g.155010  ORF Transcript_58212/g.155010 Transcript_58212/m.155010 type:complete len:194 (+) Transcript_58212:214-795(+)
MPSRRTPQPSTCASDSHASFQGETSLLLLQWDENGCRDQTLPDRNYNRRERRDQRWNCLPQYTPEDHTGVMSRSNCQGWYTVSPVEAVHAQGTQVRGDRRRDLACPSQRKNSGGGWSAPPTAAPTATPTCAVKMRITAKYSRTSFQCETSLSPTSSAQTWTLRPITAYHSKKWRDTRRNRAPQKMRVDHTKIR